MKIIIVGGGFIGQLLQAVLFPRARVFDWRASAPTMQPRQLGPQYLWEPIPELPCRKFEVFTRIDGSEATNDTMVAYKTKVGKHQDNSDWRAQFRPVMDGYDAQLPFSRVEYGRRIGSIDITNRRLNMADGTQETYDVLISTIPMPAFLIMCGRYPYSNPFRSRPIYMHHSTYQSQDRPCGPLDMHVNYLSYPHTDVYRQTIRDGRIFTESLRPFHDVHRDNVVKLAPGKIYEHEESERFQALLGCYGVACFGRFASWNPDELAHETIRKARMFKERMPHD